MPAFIRSRRRDPRISDGRPGSAAALELRPRDAARRCGASDVSARFQRRGQAILDARALTDASSRIADPVAALKAYEAERLPATSDVVLANRRRRPTPSCARSICAPATSRSRTSTTSSAAKSLMALSEGYKRVAGYDKERLKTRA